MRFELQGTFTRGEMMRFQYFHSLRRTWPVLVIAVLVVVTLLPFLVWVMISDPDSDWYPILRNAAPFFLLVAFWILLLGALPYWNAKKSLATFAQLREPFTITFTTESFSANGPSAQWTMTWPLVKRIHETKTLFLIYHGPNNAVIVPKRFFESEAQMESWRRMAASLVNTKRIEKPGVVARYC